MTQCLDCPLLDRSMMPAGWHPRASCCHDRSARREALDGYLKDLKRMGDRPPPWPSGATPNRHARRAMLSKR